MKKLTAISFFLFCWLAAWAEAALFPFQPTHDAPNNITNVQTWRGTQTGAAGAQGFIKAEGDHFVDGNGTTRRFLGTNICFTGCFPEKADAEKVAEELSRYGINLVRLHYVHHKFPKGKAYPEKDSFIEPEQLDRFDYLFAKLKEKGIYTYFQLNIARKFGEQNGFENAKKLPYYNNGIDHVDARMIELQKKYHKDILCHVNPYTGLEYRNDPAIAMLELANENSILFAWFGPKYKFDHLTEPYASQLKKQWNEYLVKKYSNTENLKKAWLSGLQGSGNEFIPEGIINGDISKLWSIQNDDKSSATYTVCTAAPDDNIKGKSFVRLTVNAKGAGVHIPQLFRANLKFKSGEPLCLRFKMRSSKASTIRVRLGQYHAPWGVAGLYRQLKTKTEWEDYEMNFFTSISDDNLRLVFSDFTPGTYDLADISLVSGIDYKWEDNISLENKNIDWPYLEAWGELPKQCEDFTGFLSDCEASYFAELYDNVKQNVHPNQPVGGTQLLFGQNLPQAKMDYCDCHNYWCHPAFPGRAWDKDNWYLMNKALVNGEAFPCSSLAMLSRNRILGKPFTISEYDHPNLNFYSAEGDILVCAIGAFQNWSAIMQFAWTHDTRFFRTDQNQRFDMCSATQKLVHFPACYAMFVRGDIQTGDCSTMYTTFSSKESETKVMSEQKTVKAPAREKSNVLASTALSIPAGRRLEELPELFSCEGKTIVSKEKDIPADISRAFKNKEMRSGTGELCWNWQKTKSGYFIADSPLTKAFTGFVRGRSFDFKGMSIKPGETMLDWITFTMTNTTPSAANTQGKLQSGSYLVAVTGVCHNTDAVFVKLGNDKLSCAKADGGKPGVAPILCEGIPLELTLNGLKGKVKCYALDPSGNRKGSVKVSADKDGNAIVPLGPKYQTVWYELIIK